MNLKQTVQDIISWKNFPNSLIAFLAVHVTWFLLCFYCTFLSLVINFSLFLTIAGLVLCYISSPPKGSFEIIDQKQLEPIVANAHSTINHYVNEVRNIVLWIDTATSLRVVITLFGLSKIASLFTLPLISLGGIYFLFFHQLLLQPYRRYIKKHIMTCELFFDDISNCIPRYQQPEKSEAPAAQVSKSHAE